MTTDDDQAKVNSVTYRVLIDDNFHYMNSEQRLSGREFITLADAVTYCRALVDDFLISTYREGMSAEQLVQRFRAFGEDPFVIAGEGEATFSAWEYAHSRAHAICAAGDLKRTERTGSIDDEGRSDDDRQ